MKMRHAIHLVHKSLLVFGAAFICPLVASAQARDPAAARVLFREARSAAAANDYATACAKFADSYKFDPAVGTLLNLADCDKRSQRLATAWVGLQKALDQLAKNDERRPIVEKLAADLEKRLPRLMLELKPGTSTEVTVERDGVVVGSSSLGVALPVDPGLHVVVVKAPGREDQRYEIKVIESQVTELQCEPGPEQVAPITAAAAPKPAAAAATPTIMPANPPPAEPPQRSHTVAYVVGGIGIAGIGVGVITRAIAFGKQSTIDGNCPNKICNQTGWDAVSSAKTLQTVSTISLIAGTAALGAGVYLRLSGGKKHEAPQVALHPLFVPAGGGLGLVRDF
jgi:hypothetical protein